MTTTPLHQVTTLLETTGLPQATLARLAGINLRLFYNKLAPAHRSRFTPGDVQAIHAALHKLAAVIQAGLPR